MCTEENKTNSEEKKTFEDSNVVIWQGGINGVVVTMPALVCYKHICQLLFATSTFAEYKQWFIYRRNIITLLAAMSV